MKGRLRHCSFFLILGAGWWLQEYGGVWALTGTVSVRTDHDECYRFRTPQSWEKDIKRNPRYLWGNFEVMDRDDESPTGPLGVFLASDNMKTILYQSPKGQSSGHFDVELEANKVYWFCISNRETVQSANEMDDFWEPSNEPSNVGFTVEIVTADQFDYTDFGGAPILDADETSKAHREAKERASNWQRIGSSLTQRLKDMKNHFNYLRTREQHHRAVTEETFTAILAWSLAQAAVVATVALAQIFFFRRYLERKNRYTVIG
ncbi:hypothetical protein ACA910_012600 [Epithemia clementina (nom. ined.)]